MELTDRNIKDAPVGSVIRDTTVKGLQLRVFEQSKSFYLYYRTKAGAQRKPKLGNYGSITISQARKAAQDLLGEVAAGRDPAAEKTSSRVEPNVQALWAEYWKRHGQHKKSGLQDGHNWNKYLAPIFAKLKLSEVSYTKVSDFMLSLNEAPYVANRNLALLSTMFNFAKHPLEWTEKNPCLGVKRYPETKRRRYMSLSETSKIAELLDASADKSPASVAFIYLLILTGARKSEIANAKWEWLNGSVLRLPDSKTGAKSVYLPPPAMDVLAKLPRDGETLTCIVSPKKLWDRIRRDAGCPDLRLHDLRHSFASAALSAGLSLAQIGELLGHKSTQTTKRYAHLVEDVASASAAMAAEHIMAGMKKAPELLTARG